MANSVREKIETITPTERKNAKKDFNNSHLDEVSRERIEEWLLYKVDPNMKNKDGDSILSYCIEHNLNDLVEKCFENGGNANGEGNYFRYKKHYRYVLRSEWFNEAGNMLKGFGVVTGIGTVLGGLVGIGFQSLSCVVAGAAIGFCSSVALEIKEPDFHGWPIEKMSYTKRHRVTSRHIMQAIYNHNEFLVDLLIKNGADVYDFNDEAGSPRALAAQLVKEDGSSYQGCLDVINKAYNDKHRRVVYVNSDDNAAPLDITAANEKMKRFDFKKGTDEEFDELIVKGASVDLLDKNGSPILITAAANGRLKIVERMLVKKVKTNVYDMKGEDALVAAVKNKHVEVAKLLLKQMNPLKSNERGFNILKIAQENDDNDMQYMFIDELPQQTLKELGLSGRDRGRIITRRAHKQLTQVSVLSVQDPLKFDAGNNPKPEIKTSGDMPTEDKPSEPVVKKRSDSALQINNARESERRERLEA